MPGRKGRTARCYRCFHTWKFRRARKPKTCPRCRSRTYEQPKRRPIPLGNGLGIEEIILPHREEILRIARKYGPGRVRVFGSVRRREATDTSDVDLLVTLHPRSSLFDYVRFGDELKTLLGREVDLVEEGRIHWAMRPQVEAEAVPV